MLPAQLRVMCQVWNLQLQVVVTWSVDSCWQMCWHWHSLTASCHHVMTVTSRDQWRHGRWSVASRPVSVHSSRKTSFVDRYRIHCRSQRSLTPWSSPTTLSLSPTPGRNYWEDLTEAAPLLRRGNLQYIHSEMFRGVFRGLAFFCRFTTFYPRTSKFRHSLTIGSFSFWGTLSPYAPFAHSKYATGDVICSQCVFLTSE